MTDYSLPNASQDLTGQVALVTGTTSGLGWRFAQVLAAAGAKVVITGRRQEKLDELKEVISAAGGDATRAAAYRDYVGSGTDALTFTADSALVAGAASVERKAAAARLAFTVSRTATGGGPVRVQATGLRADGKVVRSAPVLVWMDGKAK